MEKERNHLLAPRSVLNTKRLYTVFILKELSGGKILYGKEIYDHLHEFFKDYHIPIAYSTIYDTLHDLEKKGYIVSQWDSVVNRIKRHYRITDEGIRHYNFVSIDTLDSLKRNKNLIRKFIELLS